MAEFELTVVPIGRIDVEEVEAAIGRMVKIVHHPVELRDALPVPTGTEDPERGQHRAATIMQRLSEEVRKLRPGRLVGGAEGQKPPPRPAGFLFVTDVDLYTANTDGVFAALISARNCAVVSVRRLREAFHRRRADPNRQRTRLVKEMLRMYGRLRGLKECSNAECVLASSRSLPDLDTKEERFCRACEHNLFEGRIQV